MMNKKILLTSIMMFILVGFAVSVVNHFLIGEVACPGVTALLFILTSRKRLLK